MTFRTTTAAIGFTLALLAIGRVFVLLGWYIT